ncbi:hypothetical protein [Crassaminicella indica]|uniref:Lipoprotein n=1 Tax=Crassaminicella indica TaxID=2855394 RepID=A0ABX8RAU9_9CLOT|nr:hypothetical protein [Crassaminicella indica]QXM06177.1 hypothetical protein KVH43_12650 [Crassaminicella indica]
MKKRMIFWIPLLICIIFLQGCMDIKLDIGESIQAPKNQRIPIKGTWKIEKYKIKKYSKDKEQINYLVGKVVVFSKESVVFGDEICEKPEYKVKNVDAKDYFLYTHKAVAKDLGIQSEKIEVISITSKNQYFYDFIRINDHQLIVCVEDVFYYLSKISDATNQDQIDKYLQEKDATKEEKELKFLSSGVLIGLASSKNTNEGDFYRTLWIAAENRNLYPIVEIKDLFLPRKSGFWIVGKNRFMKRGYIKDEIFAYPLESNIKKETLESIDEQEGDEKENIKENMIREIVFVGNDYIATAYGKNIKNLSGLQMLLVDNVKKSIKISELAGDEGKDAFFYSAQGCLSKLSKSEVSKLYKPMEEDFTLSRRNGHWIMKGRLYYKGKKEKFLSFNINMIPPKKIVHYDNLYISWNEVKEREPKALDIFTSPNKDIAIVITKEAIYVYSIKNNKLSNKYIKKVELKEDERVVMAEWATGSYVKRWNNTVSNSLYVKK